VRSDERGGRWNAYACTGSGIPDHLNTSLPTHQRPQVHRPGNTLRAWESGCEKGRLLPSHSRFRQWPELSAALSGKKEDKKRHSRDAWSCRSRHSQLRRLHEGLIKVGRFGRRGPRNTGMIACATHVTRCRESENHSGGSERCTSAWDDWK